MHDHQARPFTGIEKTVVEIPMPLHIWQMLCLEKIVPLRNRVSVSPESKVASVLEVSLHFHDFLRDTVTTTCQNRAYGTISCATKLERSNAKGNKTILAAAIIQRLKRNLEEKRPQTNLQNIVRNWDYDIWYWDHKYRGEKHLSVSGI